MYNTDVNNQSAFSWDFLLNEAKQLLLGEKDSDRRKELRLSIRGFETLIRRNAPFPSEWQAKESASAATQS
jgi:hypothetical protein